MTREPSPPPASRPRVAVSVLAPIRWAVILGILISLQVGFETKMNRPGLLAALAAYGAAAALIPRLGRIGLRQGGSDRLMLAADLLMAAVISRLSGGVLSPYVGLWSLAVLHASLILRPLAAQGVAIGAAAIVIARDIYFPAALHVPLHPYIAVGKLSVLPLIAWAGGRLARELREREVARRQAVRHAAASATEEARVRQEMQAARRVQENLLPRSLPAPPGMTLDSLFLPAQEVGGDIYDVIELADGRLLVVVADVCGKGVPAALLAVAVQQGIRQFAGPEPAAVLAGLNRLLVGQCPDHLFVTAVCAAISPWDGSVVVATAGHPPPLRWEHDRERLVSLRGRGMALGLQPEWTGQTEQLTLAPGDALLLYTDGITDAKIGRRERLGVDRLARRMGESAPEDAGRWLARLGHTLHHCASRPDDATAVAIVRSPLGETWRLDHDTRLLEGDRKAA